MGIFGNVIARPKCTFILNLDIAIWIQMSSNSICETVCVCEHVCAPSYMYLGSRDPTQVFIYAGMLFIQVCLAYPLQF